MAMARRAQPVRAAAPERPNLAPTERIEIDGYTYVVSYIPTREGMRVGAKLANLLAPMIVGLRAGKGGSFMTAISYALQSPHLGDQWVELADAFSKYTQVIHPGGTRTGTLAECFDQHFAGRYDSMYKWLEFALEKNMASFLVILPDLYAKAVEATASAGANTDSTPQPDAEKTG